MSGDNFEALRGDENKKILSWEERIAAVRGEEWLEENFQRRLAEVCARYPEMAENIKRSLETPQLGPYHNEGLKMISHLKLILAVLEDIKDGKFHESIDPELAREMREAVASEDPNRPGQSVVNQFFIDYTFFHDIAKPDCMSLRFEGEKGAKAITWQEWLEIEKGGQPYKFGGKVIKSIGYYHPGLTKKDSGKKHGNAAADMVRQKGVRLPPKMSMAIRKHEIAYQFESANVDTYERNFAERGLGGDQWLSVFIASYSDTMASLKDDGQPNMDHFKNFLNARKNYVLLQEMTKNITDNAVLNSHALFNLRKANKVLTREDVEIALAEARVQAAAEAVEPQPK
ncbi:MAG: hypothetical protein WC797_01640 [Candidatus Paceibacterota bacterium]|jgi:hypothetical protein